MTMLGFGLLLMGAVLVVAEAHVPAGALGVAGGIALMIGGFVVISGLGGGAALAVPVGIALGLAAGAWTLLIARQAASGRRRRIRAGAEALCGRVGVVRGWNEPSGRVLLDGALWRARREHADSSETIGEGDRVVVEHVSGLTLCVRRAEDWELTG